MIPSPFPAILQIVSVYQGKYQKKKKIKKKKRIKKGKNTDRTQTKLIAPLTRYNVKLLRQ